MRSRDRPFLAVAAALILGMAACSGSDADGRLIVQEHGRVLNRYSVSQLQRLPQIEIATPQSHGAHSQRGPTVRSILDLAGITGVVSVRVEGRDPAQTLGGAELSDPVILNITKRHTLKLTGAKLTRDRWVRDVTALVVNP
ncbi:hypothetical protein A5791_22320 [Mycobacterium sp. 852002-51163_SCH5372311]|uniref:hypothetical protein n=1 Tax=Mycobacterium sp. 852002-51163_SCH5372311 TaxID=1834097 RepID=UPI0007FC91F7|nr:hypothetical protein [Mycobacterium sp. 852002-51163_SCH5372311]OBF85667.1 hypothetical protein A5791_22320 [Mycobacterium sp. 852002-51163_SCH5372311]